MAQTIIYVCQQCGKTSSKWLGKCIDCGAWNSYVEEVTAGRSSRVSKAQPANPTPLSMVSRQQLTRISTGNVDVDQVLGGGVVPGSILLLGGEPGIGKSTLLMQIAGYIKNTLYVTGEESLDQVSARADRLKVKENVNLLQATDLDVIIATVERHKPSIVIIDSIQTVVDSNYPGSAGSIVQVRGGASRLQSVAKSTGVPIILVGHVTKEGTIAGPRTLEHIVDVVLSFEGDAFQNSRVVRGIKNRYGATNEVAILSMTNHGLESVKNPSALFLSDSPESVPGSAISSVLEGRQPLLVEVQALTVPTSFGYPKRTAVGIDLNRLQILVAVLQRRAGLHLESHDVYVNVVGGIRTTDPGLDLAVCLAIASSLLDQVLPQGTVFIGEVGLLGEIRAVTKQSERFKEAKKIGFLHTVNTKNLVEALNKVFKGRL